MLDSAAVGAIIGFLGRAGPEVLKFARSVLDDRHELAMQRLALEFQKVAPNAARKMAEMGVTGAQLQEVFNLQREAWSQQFNTGKPWLNTVSVLVRPVSTATLLALYVGVKIKMVGAAVELAPMTALAYTENDVTLLAGILAFWFSDRHLFKQGGSVGR